MKRLQYRNIFGRIVKIEGGGEGVTSVSSLPESGQAGKIYYNTTNNTYYVWDSEASAFTPLGVDETVVITEIDDVERLYVEVPGGPSQSVANGFVLDPGVFYNIDYWNVNTGNSLTFGFDPSLPKVYAGRFTAWDDDISINLPAGVSLPDETVNIVSGHTYEFNIWQGVCIIQDVTTSRSIYNEPGLEPKS